MPEIIGDGFEIPVRADLGVDFDPASLRELTKSFSREGERMGKGLATELNKSLGPASKEILKSLGPDATRIFREQFIRSFEATFDNVVKTYDASMDRIKASSTAAANSAKTEFIDAGQGIDQANEAGSRFERELRQLLKLADGMEGPFKATFRAIVADLQLASKEISQGIVNEQSQQQQTARLEAQAKRELQLEKIAARERQAILQAALREEEQTRQAANRSQLLQERTVAAQSNSILNAALQENLIDERAAAQRRQAIVRASLDATRSLYQSVGSGLSSIVGAAYTRMRGETEAGEARITAANREGLIRRKTQTNAIMSQQLAEVRRQQGVYLAAQQQLDRGVLGAAAGTSAFGAGLRGLALGGAGVFGLGALIKEASGFEANLRIFRELNPEIKTNNELFQQLRQTAIDLGNDIALPGVSAADAADAITSLAKTGLDMSTSIDSARASLLLARVAGIDFTESARTIGSTLNALKLEGSDATKVVDGLASALRLSGGATFDEIRQGQQQALLVFRTSFKEVEKPLDLMNQLNASLALFSRNALRGSDAGTSLKTFLQSLQGKSEIQEGNITEVLKAVGESGNFLFDAAGRARGFSESIDLVRRSFNALDPAARAKMIQEIFGADAGRAAEIFISSTKQELDELIAQVGDAEGLTLRLAEAQNQGLLAAFDAFVSTIETIFIQLFAFVDKPLGRIVTFISDVIGSLAQSPSLTLVRQALFGIAAGLLAVATAKAGLEALRLTGLFLGAMASPMGVITLAAAGLGAAIVLLYRNSEPFAEFVRGLPDLVGRAAGAIRDFFAPVLERLGEQAVRAYDLVRLLGEVLFTGEFVGDLASQFGIREDDPIIEILLNVRDTAISTFETVREYVGQAADAIADGFSRIAQAAGDIDYAAVFAPVLAFLSGVGEAVGNTLETVSTGVEAMVRTIQEVGVLEGLRQGAVLAFEGIKALIGGILEDIGSLFSDAFSGVDWGGIAGDILAGIFRVFRAIGRALGAFVGSNEFTGTVTIAVATLIGIIGSAVGGLATGIIDGLRQSDLAGNIARFIGDQTREGIELALVGLFPPALLKRVITDPFSSALGVTVLIVEALLIGKIVTLFRRGFSGIADAVGTIRTLPAIANRGLNGVEGALTNSASRWQQYQARVAQTNAIYGNVGGAAVRAADAVFRFGDRFGLAGRQLEQAERPAQRLIQNWWDPLPQKAAAGETAVRQFTTSYLTSMTTLTNVASSALAGLSLGAAITADDPVGKISGVAFALISLTPVIQSVAATAKAAGLGSALFGAAPVLALTAIVAAVTIFATRGKEAEAGAEAVKRAAESYTSSFQQIVSAGSGTAAGVASEFFVELARGSSDLAKDFKAAVKGIEGDLNDSALALIGSDRVFNDWRDGVVGSISDVEAQIAATRAELEAAGGSFNPYGSAQGVTGADPAAAKAAEDRLEILKAQREELVAALLTIDGTRLAYEQVRESSAQELLIRRNFIEVEQERLSATSQIRDTLREERDVVGEIANNMRDLIGLEDGRRAANSERGVRGSLRSLASSFLPTEGEAVLSLESLLSNTSARGDELANSLEAVRNEFANVAAEAAASATSQQDYLDRLELYRLSFIQTLTEAGLSPEDAAVAAEAILSPFRQAEFAAQALFVQIEEDIATLKARIGEALDVEAIPQVDTTNADEALKFFLSDPSEKTIQPLLDLGVPTDAIREFVQEPTEKNIAAILEPLQLRLTQDQITQLGLPTEKAINPFVAPGPYNAAENALNALARTRQAFITPVIGQPYQPFGALSGLFPGASNRRSGGGSFANNKYGSVITKPTLTWVGEEKRKEVIFPLTMPNRALQLYHESGLADVLAKARGGGPLPATPRSPAVRSGATSNAQLDELRLLRAEVRALRRDTIESGGGDTFQVQSTDPPAVAREVARQKRRARRRRARGLDL